MRRSNFSWARPTLYFVISILIFLSVSRLLLMWWQLDKVIETDGFAFIFFQGIRFDLVLLGIILLLPVGLLPLFTAFKPTMKPYLRFLHVLFLMLTAFLVFSELATPNFITQFGFRPNILAVEYLKYPKEVLSMLFKAYPLQIALALLSTVAAVYGMHRLLKPAMNNARQGFPWVAPLLGLLVVVLCFSAARSTLGHRPVNPSTVVYSSDPLVNSLSLSSGYSVLYALYEKNKYENGQEDPYGTMAEADIYREIYSAMHLPQEAFYNLKIPTLHQQSNAIHEISHKPKNLVIILEESLGADYVHKLGGPPITPHLDRLAEEGIWFNQLYATGTRSVRGIEAVVTGFLPTPARSVVKLGGSQHNFFTMAQLLSQQDYSTSFIYGGEAHFDNMGRFFSNNGFNTIIDEKDYKQPKFRGSWGVSDEDLFDKAHETFIRHHENKKPFFSLVFTSSNHTPFDFPDGRIELYDEPKETVSNAVKYTDYALNEYFKKAKQSSYWQDTVFLVIADHSDRVYGAELVPIEKFRIPALILGANIKPKVVNRICSQIDMLPTLLSLIDVDARHPSIGIDLTRADINEIPGRAIMQYAGNQAYMQEEQVVIMQKNLPLTHYDYKNSTLRPAPEVDVALGKRALAHALWPMMAYKSKTYRLPPRVLANK